MCAERISASIVASPPRIRPKIAVWPRISAGGPQAGDPEPPQIMDAERTLPPVHVARRLFLAQTSPVVIASLLAAWAAQSSQEGGISPAAALICPALGPLSMFLVEPNRRESDELSPMLWMLVIASMVAVAWLLRRPHLARRRASMVAWAAVSFAANALWSATGLARVAYSMS